MGDREELADLRRLAELEAKAAPKKSGLERFIPGYGIDPASPEGKQMRSDVREKAIDIGMGFGPASLVTGASAKLFAPAMKSGAESLMQSALKPTLKQLERGEAQTAVKTLLEEGLNPTQGGVKVLRERSSEVSKKLAEALKSSNASVKVGEVGVPLVDTMNRATRQVNPTSDVEAVKTAWNEFRNLHPQVAGKSEIPVQLAQQLKTGTYRQLADKYGELGSATTEAQKALARGLKEGIEKAVPEVSALNSRQSQILEALDVTERRALMEMNKNPLGLSLLAENKSAWAAFMADKSALFKSLAAHLLYKGSQKMPENLSGLGTSAYGEAIQQEQR